MNKFKALLCAALVITFLFTGIYGVQADTYGSYFESMIQFMNGMYYKGLTDEQGLKSALRGMFSGLDKYSAFYDNEETEALNSSLSGNFVGIGAGLEKSNGFVKIIKVYEASPAEKAGILEGDLIIAVDGTSTENKDAETVAASIRGDEGTAVRLTIRRGTVTKEYTLVRGNVTISSVQYRIEGKMAYIRIDSFYTGTSAKFNEAMAQVNKNNIRKIILDLRGNPGGYVDEAVKVTEKLIRPGIITTLDYKTIEISDRFYYSEEKHPDYLVAVLVDENSASASEIVAGALEDSGNGFLIGQKTYGKGVFQNIFSVLTPEAYEKYAGEFGGNFVTDIHLMSYFGVYPGKDEILGSVKLTTGHYLTPKGRAIDGVGLTPSITVKNPASPNGVNLSLVGSLSNASSLTIDNYGVDVVNAERILKAAGFFSAAPDKQFGTETRDAVMNYQSKLKLEKTGIIDAVTRDQLNRTLIYLRNANDKQYTKAAEVLHWFRD